MCGHRKAAGTRLQIWEEPHVCVAYRTLGGILIIGCVWLSPMLGARLASSSCGVHAADPLFTSRWNLRRSVDSWGPRLLLREVPTVVSQFIGSRAKVPEPYDISVRFGVQMKSPCLEARKTFSLVGSTLLEDILGWLCTLSNQDEVNVAY